ncbi:hypothetical protein RS9916_38637 [Synechococcus sp. RS9916]|nr:hypothetical protein RS9916_38637 [Synechococcus sp. RS9916]
MYEKAFRIKATDSMQIFLSEFIPWKSPMIGAFKNYKTLWKEAKDRD